ncbi:MAG: hypothetical protein LBD23_03800 [Oscillospiraceae bacterium]|jgi:hypothetical protein|nr:hypothetical protein [Oscillospiraceae bacterium]
MKLKIILSFIVVISLLISLCGCNNSTTNIPNDDIEKDSIVNSDDVADEDSFFRSRRNRWVEIPIGENSGFSDEVFKIIEMFKSMKEDDEYYTLYSSQELPDISEFYSLDKLKIEGYKLEKAFVNSVNFIYQYFPYNYDEELASISDRIVITITRQDWIDTHLPDTDLLINAMESYDPGIANLTKDNMLYFETAGLIQANIGRTTVSIQPQSLEKHDNYEYLYNLALLITETAELISVKT